MYVSNLCLLTGSGTSQLLIDWKNQWGFVACCLSSSFDVSSTTGVWGPDTAHGLIISILPGNARCRRVRHRLGPTPSHRACYHSQGNLRARANSGILASDFASIADDPLKRHSLSVKPFKLLVRDKLDCGLTKPHREKYWGEHRQRSFRRLPRAANPPSIMGMYPGVGGWFTRRFLLVSSATWVASDLGLFGDPSGGCYSWPGICR